MGTGWRPAGDTLSSIARADSLLHEALKLSPKERADVAAELLASLDDDLPDDREAVERAWGAEIERRARRVLAGESAGVPWDEVGRDLEDRLAKRRTSVWLLGRRS